MKDLSNNAVITKAKTIFGHFLKPDDYERMLKLRSLPDLVSFLKKSPNYEMILSGVQEGSIHRGQLELMIKKSHFEQILRLIKMIHSSDLEFYLLNIVYQESELILSSLRTIISMEFEDNIGKLPIFFEVHTKIDVHKLLKVETFDDLLDAIKNSPYYQILKPYRTDNPEMIRYLDIEHELEVYYYEEAFKRINKHYSGSLKKEIEGIFQTRIELANITKIYRLKKFYQATPQVIKDVLIKDHVRISEKKWDEMIALSNPDQIVKYLSHSEYQKFVNEKDYVYIEYFAGKIRYDLARKYIYFASEVPKVFMSFVTLGQMEIENITNIIEGIRYQVDEAEIKAMLIY
ncbi:MAG TPA: V-type ATPase subunit [Acholeplasmataceae bacterium]|nr:V-type ATPase subunit [Acholeplasmataceae bacterium]HRX44998.1 V-type ATPase subunit [Acholeplasmataceae bacterium]